MKNILVPIDFSDISETVITRAIEMAKAFKGTVNVLHVSLPAMTSMGMMADPMYGGHLPGTNEARQLMENDLKSLEKLCMKMTGKGFEMTWNVKGGSPVEEILREAESFKADLIVLGSHGHGELYHMILGSVSGGILRKAPCPVMVVHNKEARQSAAPADTNKAIAS